MGLSRIVRGALVVAMLGGVPGLVAHGDPPVLPVPKAPAGSSASADAALAAFQKGDAKALEAVSKGKSDPWVVATVLLERGEAKAAAAFAAVALRPCRADASASPSPGG